MAKFKYIKREWKNGKWEYTYPYDSVAKNKKPGVLDKIKDKLGVDEKKRYQEAKAKVDTANKRLADTKNRVKIDRRLSNTERDELTKAAIKNHINAGINYVETKEEYSKTPMAKIDKASETMNKGMQFVKDFINEQKKKVDQRKNAERDARNRIRREKGRVKEWANQYYKQEQEEERSTIREPELSRIKDELAKKNPLPEFPIKHTATTLDEDMAAVNENYNPLNPNTSMNCAYCTLAYDLRRRGYDVEAAEIESTDSAPSMLSYYEIDKKLFQTERGWMNERVHTMYSADGEIRGEYEKKDKETVSDLDVATENLEKSLLSYGEGARGNIGLHWTAGGGHSIVWQVENNKVVYRDCQTNKIIKFNDYASRSREFNYTRLDDLTPNKKMLNRVRRSD